MLICLFYYICYQVMITPFFKERIPMYSFLFILPYPFSLYALYLDICFLLLMCVMQLALG